MYDMHMIYQLCFCVYTFSRGECAATCRRDNMALDTTNETSSLISERILRDLRRRIMTLEIPPGKVVTESYLADVLQCGRTPLRDALQHLSHEYLVEILPRRGIAIAGLDIADFMSAAEASRAVEGLAARLAAERITSKQIAELEANVIQTEALIKDDDYPALADLDHRFHVSIARGTGNSFLADIIARLHAVRSRFGFLAWRQQLNRQHSVFTEHRGIFEAIRQRNGPEAEQRAMAHLQHSRERVIAAAAGQTLPKASQPLNE